MAGRTILIVDDHEGARSVLTAILHPLHQVVAVGSAEAAMAAFVAHSIDLVFLDLHLPDDSGLHVLRKLKVVRPQLKVIMMSKAGTVESAFEAIQLGALAYLLKPFNSSEVLDLVQDAVSP